MSLSNRPTDPTRGSRRGQVSMRPSSRLYTPTGTLAWGMIAKVGSGIATAIGIVTFVVGLGIRYGKLQSTVETQTKEIEALHSKLRDMAQEQNQQIDRVAFAIKAQNELIVHLRIAVAASAAADEVRRGGTYDRSEVLGVPSAPRPPPSRRGAEKQARRDALEALDRSRTLDPLAGLDGL